jgi:hypothetical protein
MAVEELERWHPGFIRKAFESEEEAQLLCVEFNETMMGTWTQLVFLEYFEGTGWVFGVPVWQYSKSSDIGFYWFYDESSTKWERGVDGLFGMHVLGLHANRRVKFGADLDDDFDSGDDDAQ